MAISFEWRYGGSAASAMPPATARNRSGRLGGGQFFQQRPKLGGVQRLVKKERRAELRRRLADVAAGMVAVDDLHEPRMGRVVRQVLEHAKPVALAQFQVQNHDVAGLAVQPGKGAGLAFRESR